MKYAYSKIVFQEVPDEITLMYQMTGCGLKCPGCHSADLRNTSTGFELSIKTLQAHIDRNREAITCIGFLGGEWYSGLLSALEFVHMQGLKTCLYTGLEYSEVPKELFQHLDYLKYGPYRHELGPLSNAKTNQVFLNLKENKDLTYLFHR